VLASRLLRLLAEGAGQLEAGTMEETMLRQAGMV
jgi:hypothetical protein